MKSFSQILANFERIILPTSVDPFLETKNCSLVQLILHRLNQILQRRQNHVIKVKTEYLCLQQSAPSSKPSPSESVVVTDGREQKSEIMLSIIPASLFHPTTTHQKKSGKKWIQTSKTAEKWRQRTRFRTNCCKMTSIDRWWYLKTDRFCQTRLRHARHKPQTSGITEINVFRMGGGVAGGFFGSSSLSLQGAPRALVVCACYDTLAPMLVITSPDCYQPSSNPPYQYRNLGWIHVNFLVHSGHFCLKNCWKTALHRGNSSRIVVSIYGMVSGMNFKNIF